MKRVCMIDEDDFDSCMDSINNMVVMMDVYMNMIINGNLSLDDMIGKLSEMNNNLQWIRMQMTKYDE